MSRSFLCFRPGSETNVSFFFFNDTATTEIYTLSLHDALPISLRCAFARRPPTRWEEPSRWSGLRRPKRWRSEEHTSELQSLRHLVCRLLLEKKKTKKIDDRGLERPSYM